MRAYHYCYADSVQDAIDEANFCLENISGEKFEYPIAIDFEDRCLLNLSKTLRDDICTAFCETIEKANYYAMIYCSLDWYKNVISGEKLSKRFDFWLADWHKGSRPEIDCGMFQYTNEGELCFVEDKLFDLDRCLKIIQKL